MLLLWQPDERILVVAESGCGAQGDEHRGDPRLVGIVIHVVFKELRDGCSEVFNHHGFPTAGRECTARYGDCKGRREGERGEGSAPRRRPAAPAGREGKPAPAWWWGKSLGQGRERPGRSGGEQTWTWARVRRASGRAGREGLMRNPREGANPFPPC
jgi:hypothetical protein